MKFKYLYKITWKLKENPFQDYTFFQMMNY